MIGLRKDLERAIARIDSLEKENEELRRRLNLYENPHTPSSKQRFPPKELIPEEEKKQSGQKQGHNGTTRQQAKPQNTVDVTAKKCLCGKKLGLPSWIETKIIEDIPEPQPIIVTQPVRSQYKRMSLRISKKLLKKEH